MKFKLVYSKRARARLAAAWLGASDRNAVTRVIAQIERQLRFDPLQAGESRSGTNRVIISSPLVVTYSVILDDNKVRVTDVRHD
jgi:hypothetical protein